MKAVISSTYDDLYLFFLPITTWCWNKLGVDVICFLPKKEKDNKFLLVNETMIRKCPSDNNWLAYFDAPENKQATYSQCSRLYAAAIDHLPEDEVLITSDIDMGIFQLPPYAEEQSPKIAPITIFGTDLVPEGQFPMCYASAMVKDWRKIMRINGKKFQECLDEQLAHEEMENMRGNLWSRDQELLFKYAWMDVFPVNRAREGTQFAALRYDRDDSFLLERLSPDTIDFHMPRPGYEDKAFEIILTVLKYHYPNDDFQWLIDYKNQYQQLV